MNQGLNGWPMPAPPNGVLFDLILPNAQATIPIVIPQMYADLSVTVIARGDAAAASVNAQLQFNGDAAANYNYIQLRANGAGVAQTASSAQTSGVFLQATAATSTANVWGTTVLSIPDYARPNAGFKTWKATTGPFNSSNAIEVDLWSGYWASQNPITLITLLLSSGNFLAGTRVRVLGT